jgi:hypothetical protein
MEPTPHPTARIDDSGAHPHLTLADVHAALAYYYDHVEEIEAEFARDDEAETNFEERKTQVLADRARRSPR